MIDLYFRIATMTEKPTKRRTEKKWSKESFEQKLITMRACRGYPYLVGIQKKETPDGLRGFIVIQPLRPRGPECITAPFTDEGNRGL